MKLWGFLEARFFSQLDSEYVPVYQSFLNALMKYYLVVSCLVSVRVCFLHLLSVFLPRFASKESGGKEP